MKVHHHTLFALFLMVIVGFTASCSKKSIVESSQENITKIAKDHLGAKASVTPNASETLYLFHVEESNLVTRFMVCNKKGVIIFPVQSYRGEVSWHSDNQIALLSTPGVVDKRSGMPERKTTIIDVIENKEEI